jgi:glycerophosphoryl diester phosphodiesterase
MEAFAGSVAIGFKHLETDLHLTADGELVCFHDHTVDRTTNGTGPVETFTLDELKRLDAGYRHGARGGLAFRGSGITVPTLEEAMLAFPEVRFVVDLKRDGLEAPLAELISRLDAPDRLIVGSFDDGRLETFRRLTNGSVATSTGPMLTRMWVLASRAGRGVPGSKAVALQVPLRMRGVRVVDEKLISSAHAAGMQVHVWTVNQREEMNRLLDMGVDGLISDRPDILREVMEVRGQWPHP